MSQCWTGPRPHFFLTVFRLLQLFTSRLSWLASQTFSVSSQLNQMFLFQKLAKQWAKWESALRFFFFFFFYTPSLFLITSSPEIIPLSFHLLLKITLSADLGAPKDSQLSSNQTWQAAPTVMVFALWSFGSSPEKSGDIQGEHDHIMCLCSHVGAQMIQAPQGGGGLWLLENKHLLKNCLSRPRLMVWCDVYCIWPTGSEPSLGPVSRIWPLLSVFNIGKM